MRTKILQGAAVIIGIVIVALYLIIHKAPSSAPSQTGTEAVAGQKSFNSDTLGISFKYLPDQDADGTDDTTVKEDGDKVYVYYSASKPEDGQWIQKFTKDSSDTLEQAIQKQFLQKYSDKDCYPMDLADLFKSYDSTPPAIPDNFVEAVITYPKTTDPAAPFFQNADKCPPTYTFTNGLSYFLMDKNHTDKYYFVNIGQYAILADPTGPTAWQDTLTIK